MKTIHYIRSNFIISLQIVGSSLSSTDTLFFHSFNLRENFKAYGFKIRIFEIIYRISER